MQNIERGYACFQEKYYSMCMLDMPVARILGRGVTWMPDLYVWMSMQD